MGYQARARHSGTGAEAGPGGSAVAGLTGLTDWLPLSRCSTCAVFLIR